MTPLPVGHRLLCPWDSPGKNSGVVTIPFSGGSPWPRDWTWASCFTSELLPSEPAGKPFKNGVFISNSPLALLNFSPISLKADVLGTHIIHAGLLTWKAWCGGQAPCSRRTSYYFHLWSTRPELWVLTVLHLHPAYLSPCGFSFISLVVDLFFLLSSYSVHSCNFSMPVGRGGLRVFLLCLGYFSADFLLKDILPDEQNFNSFICSANIADHKIRFRKNLKTEDTDMSMPQSLASRNPKSFGICICQQHGNYFLPFVGKIVSLQLRHSLQQGNNLITVPLSFQVWLLLNRHRQIGMSSLSCP